MFIPEEYCENVKMAMFSAGAGKIGNYDSCSFDTVGEGQFRPLQGCKAFLGTVGKLEKVREIRVEMVCEDSLLKAVVLAMRDSHPYEVPAFDIIDLFNIDF